MGLLQRLGLRRLGDLAALPARDVLTRFGSNAARLHRLVRGADPAQPAPRTPPPDLTCAVAFEPPLDSVEAVCFSVRRTCEELLTRLASHALVCTAVRIEAEGDDRAHTLLSARTWVHARWFGAADLVDRVHWQLQAAPHRGGVVGAPVALVRFVPETVEPAAEHADGLWGGNGAERVDRGVARVQALLGYDAVVVPVRQGGRAPADRQALVPWGERPVGLRPLDLPWPGAVPGPAPTRVFPEAWATAMVGPGGRPVVVDDRGAVSCEPTRFHTGELHGWQQVRAWAGPWPVEERWWVSTGLDRPEPEPRAPDRPSAPRGPVARFQVVGADGAAWLMRCEGDRWWTEAAYE